MTKTSVPKLHSYKPKTGRNHESVVFPESFQVPENIPAIAVLEGAAIANLSECVVFGYDQQGGEYIAGTSTDVQRAAYMFARGQLNMLGFSDDTNN